MARNVKDLLAEANSSVPRLSPSEAAEKMRAGEVLVVDVRDPTEVQQTGKLKGAINVSRGMLEFRADPESQYHNPEFQKDRTVLLHCASGGRSALAGKTLQDMGYTAVFNIGGFKDLAEAGIDTEPTKRVYRAAFEAALAAPGKATIVASIVETGDQRLIKSLFQKVCGDQDKVNLVIVRIAGTDKRDALAYGFRAIARQAPAPDDVVAVIDGDSIVPPDLVWKCAGFFRLDPAVGALTTDEASEVRGARIFQEWYALRFAQRHTLMSSVGLSERVLTLTGRMSMFRANIVCNPEFIRQVELDYVDHWRLGCFKFLTGDDKSSWFWLLRNGYKMLYVPDVVVLTVEDPPSENFISAAAMLMVRWFGNMLRTNSRALALGPRKIGLFTWWAILDQRMSMWTSLVGFAVALLAAIFISGYALLLYALWILSSRYILTLSLLAARPRVSVFYPFLLYFNQIFGSLIKVHVTFRLDRQKWTRQKTTSGSVAKRPLIASNFMSAYMHGLALTAFLTVLAWGMEVLPTPTPMLFLP